VKLDILNPAEIFSIYQKFLNCRSHLPNFSVYI